MSDLKIKIGCYDYDHTHSFFDGSVKIEGVDASYETSRNFIEIFERMMRGKAFDVSELGLTYYLRTLDLDDPPFIALPIFTARHFRHSAIFVNKSSGIEKPSDLAGKTVGELATFGHDAGVWAKGILSDDYGVMPEQCRWITGGTDIPIAPLDFIPHPHPEAVAVTAAPKGKALGPMLEAGEIDALISALVPQCILDDSPKVARLFPDYEFNERAYYKRTGIFPIMHTVVVRRELLAAHPKLAKKIYQGFCDAKEAAMERYRKDRTEQHITTMIPWFDQLFDENRRLFPDDWWAYGIKANRKTIDTYLRYYFEQGLSKRRLTCEDIFAPELMET